MDKRIFLNNEFIPAADARIHVSDLAIQRGYGVFDFLAVRNGEPRFLDQHLDRFFYSASRMRLPLACSAIALKDIIHELLALNDAQDCGVRLTLTGGLSENGYSLGSPNLIISTHTLPPRPATPLKLMTHPYQRQFADVKTIDYLMGIWLQSELNVRGMDDVLYYSNGFITECPRSNIFIVTATNEVLTPRAGMLKGITRDRLLNITDSIYSIKEADITLEQLNAATQVFITSTTKGVFPVFSIDGRKLMQGGVISYFENLLNEN